MPFACRDPADQGCQPLPASLLVIDRDHVGRIGTGIGAARLSATWLRKGDRKTVLIYLDGLAWDELVTVLSIAVGSGHAVRVQVPIYNPISTLTARTAAAWPLAYGKRSLLPPPEARLIHPPPARADSHPPRAQQPHGACQPPPSPARLRLDVSRGGSDQFSNHRPIRPL